MPIGFHRARHVMRNCQCESPGGILRQRAANTRRLASAAAADRRRQKRDAENRIEPFQFHLL